VRLLRLTDRGTKALAIAVAIIAIVIALRSFGIPLSELPTRLYGGLYAVILSLLLLWFTAYEIICMVRFERGIDIIDHSTKFYGEGGDELSAGWQKFFRALIFIIGVGLLFSI
jgi:hypothetical protein